MYINIIWFVQYLTSMNILLMIIITLHKKHNKHNNIPSKATYATTNRL